MENKDLIFKPKINKKSEKINKYKIDRINNVVDRLMDFSKKKFEKNLKKIEKKNNLLKNLFSPKIEKTILKDEIEENFLERQNIFLEKKNLLQKIKQDELFLQKCTFEPKINFRSKILILKKRENLIKKNNLDFLYEIPIKKKKIFLEEIKKKEEKKFSFKPKINSISKIIAKKKTIEELNDNSKKKKNLEKMRKLKIKKELINCTFKPKINKNYKKIISFYEKKIFENSINFFQEQKNLKKNIFEKEKEFSEIKNCTFKPKICKKKKIDSEKKINFVKGFDKFLENVEKSKKIKIEQKKFEEKIFYPEKFYDYEKHKFSTKIEPFELSQTPFKFVKNNNQKKNQDVFFLQE